MFSTAKFTLGVDFERLFLRGTGDITGIGNDDANQITGNSGNNLLGGGRGNDSLSGAAGDDVPSGGLGRDALRGDGGADTFRFTAAAHSLHGANRDVILDFTVGVDTLDLSGIDAIPGGVNNGFSLVGAFTGAAGQLRQSGDLILADLNGDKVADMDIRIANGAVLALGDYSL